MALLYIDLLVFGVTQKRYPETDFVLPGIVQGLLFVGGHITSVTEHPALPQFGITDGGIDIGVMINHVRPQDFVVEGVQLVPLHDINKEGYLHKLHVRDYLKMLYQPFAEGAQLHI